MMSASSLLILSVMILAAQADHHRASSQQCNVGSNSASGKRGFAVVTTTTLVDFPSQSQKMMAKIGDYISDDEIAILKNSWNVVKNRGTFAPKIFIRYLKAKPETQRLFPAFSHVPISDLPSNPDFLLRAYSCVNSLNSMISTLKSDISPSNCPIFTALKNKYKESDVKSLNTIWMMAMEEELGNKFTHEVRDAWQNAFNALNKFSSSK